MESDNLLSKLLETERMDFNEVARFILNRNRAQKIIAGLLRKKLINQDPKNWRPGQKKFYSLTEKGELQAYRLDISNINKSLRRLQKISSGLLSDRNLMSEYQLEMVFSPTREELNAGRLNKEKALIRGKEKDELIGPLRSTFMELTKILMQAESFGDPKTPIENVVIYFTKERPLFRISP